MSPFVKAAEVWVPEDGVNALRFGSGAYGKFDELRRFSHSKRFGYGRGLPGKAWAEGIPVLMQTNAAEFERTELTRAAGITTGIALPVFAGDYLQGVAVFFCGDEQESAGAIEIWQCDTEVSYDLKLREGYFGKLEHFESVSKQTAFRKGTGLPGKVWQTGMPRVMTDLGRSHQFVRFDGAHKAGLTTGLAIPLLRDGAPAIVMTFLSALGTPIARQMEVWVPEEGGSALRFDHGYSERGAELSTQHATVRISSREGLLGQAFFSGRPIVSDDPKVLGPLAVEASLVTAIAIPVLERGRCKAVVVLYG